MTAVGWGTGQQSGDAGGQSGATGTRSAGDGRARAGTGGLRATTARRGRRRALPASVAAVVLSATAAVALPGPATGPAAPAGAEHVAALLGAAAPAGVDLSALDLVRPSRASMPEAASAADLNASVAGLARTMGVAPPAASPAVADLPAAVRGGLVQALDVLSVCAATTRGALDALGGVLGLAAAMQQQQAVDPGLGVRLRSCAVDLRAALAGLELAVGDAPVSTVASTTTSTSCAPTVDGWPVLAVDLDEGQHNCYSRDYALVVDGDGDDLYDNNAGSNLLDLQLRSDPQQLDPLSKKRAQGCRHAIPGLVARDCTPLAAALLDVKGNDHYGLLEPPFGDLPLSFKQVEDRLPPAPVPDLFAPLRPTDRPGDAHCTKENVVARVSTQGAGLLGVGMLVDAKGDDVYRAKTGSQGTGHVHGVGVLLDGAGTDRYTAIRNSQGFGLIGAIGLLGDTSGNDTYEWHMPAPRTVAHPQTSGEEPVFRADGKLNPRRGIGGVVDDAGFCDNIPRFLQGAANLTSVGALIDAGGADSYAGAGARNGVQPALAVPLDRTTGSQGFGSQGSVGVFMDVPPDVSLDVPPDVPLTQEEPVAADQYSEADRRNERGNDRLRVDCTLGGAGLFVDVASQPPAGGVTEACQSVPDRPLPTPPGVNAG